MPTKVTPNNVAASLKAAQADKLVDDAEVAALSPAIIRDLAKSDDPVKTLKLAAENIAKFIEPFKANDLQEAGGILLDRRTRYELQDLVNNLEKSAKELDKLKAGAFQIAMGLTMQDGKVDVAETKALDQLARKMLAGAQDPGAIARALRGMLLELEAFFAQHAALGVDGPKRDEVIPPDSSKNLAKINALLGKAIAKGLEGVSANEKVEKDSPFAKGVKEIVDSDAYGRHLLLEMLPRLVDQEVAMFDATGLRGPAKLRMEQQAEARAAALLKHVDGLRGDDLDDVKQAVYRIVTGRFAPESTLAEFKKQLETLDSSELRDGLKSFQARVAELASADSFSVKNERKGLQEGIALVEAELARRAEASGASTLSSAERKQAVIKFVKDDDNIKQLLADGARLDESTVKIFTWVEARDAIKADRRPGDDLDVVLQNMSKENAMLRRDRPDNIAFARVALNAPGEEPFPLTVVIKREGTEWKPVRVADDVIPF